MEFLQYPPGLIHIHHSPPCSSWGSHPADHKVSEALTSGGYQPARKAALKASITSLPQLIFWPELGFSDAPAVIVKILSYIPLPRNPITGKSVFLPAQHPASILHVLDTSWWAWRQN